MDIKRHKVGVLLDRDTLDRGDIDFSALQRTLPQWELHGATRPEELSARLARADVVVSNKVVLDRSAIASASRLSLIAIAATGTNNVDLEAAEERGIRVCNVRAYATASVAQHVFTLILALTRRLPRYQAAVRQGRWQASPQFCLLDFPLRELNGQTLGIVGYGELGRAVGELGKAFGMELLIAQRPGSGADRSRLPLRELLSRADVLSLHCPLTAQTRGLIGPAELRLMKEGALLINTARGGIVDEHALADALRAGRLGGAGIDVLAQEPPGAASPLLAPDIPHLIVTPHIAWASQEARQRLVDGVAENIAAFLAGEPRNLVAGALRPTANEEHDRA